MPRNKYLWPQSTAAPLIIWLISAVIFYCLFQMAFHNQAPPAPTSSGTDAILFNFFHTHIIKPFNFLWVIDRSFLSYYGIFWLFLVCRLSLERCKRSNL